jgi:D-sedoheptulose 7-phosphate isomerase
MAEAEMLAEGAGNGVGKGTGVSETAERLSPSEAIIVQRIQAHMEITQQLLQQASLCLKVAERLIAAFTAGNKALLCGNGGSAADAQHIAAEFVGKFYFDRPPLPAEALTVNTSSLTAIGNDYSFDQIFSRQIEAFGNAGDVCIGISTSGNSRNVVAAFRAARRKDILTVALTGATGGEMATAADYCIRIPSTDTPRIQEHHILVGHILCELVEQALFADVVAARQLSRVDTGQV